MSILDDVTRMAPAELPEVRLGSDVGRCVDETITVLAGPDADFYQRGGNLVRIVEVAEPGAASKPRIEVPKRAHIRDRLSLLARFTRRTQNKDTGEMETRRMPVPGEIADMVLERHEYAGIRVLAGIVTVPTFCPDGSILQTEGYHAPTGNVYRPDGVFKAVPDAPTLEDARAAIRRLFAPLDEFHWKDEVARAAWLAVLLTVLARDAIAGPVPMFFIQGNVAGCGKGKLASRIGILGGSIHKTSQAEDEAEWRKSILSYAMAAHRVVLVDNVRGAFGCPSLEMAITEQACGNRALGTNDAVDVPARMVWLVTANAPILVGDMPRRIVLIELSSQVEKPEERTFKSDVDAEARENRADHVRDALTILRAYHVANRPPQKLRPFGSFEAWSRLIRSAIVWAGMPDPLGDRRQHETLETPEVAALRRLHQHVDGLPGRTFTARQLLDASYGDVSLADALAELAPPKPPATTPTPKSLGWAIRRTRDRVLGNTAIRFVSEGRDGTIWKLEHL